MRAKALSCLVMLVLCLEPLAAGAAQRQAPYPASLPLKPQESVDTLTPWAYLPVVYHFNITIIKPVILSPVEGEWVNYTGTWVFHVKPLPNATGYLWGFEQNGVLVWENYHNEGTLSGEYYTIPSDSYAHSLFQLGYVKVWVRALIFNEWTDITFVNIFLV
jgi:hypothetical protein